MRLKEDNMSYYKTYLEAQKETDNWIELYLIVESKEKKSQIEEEKLIAEGA